MNLLIDALELIFLSPESKILDLGCFSYVQQIDLAVTNVKSNIAFE